MQRLGDTPLVEGIVGFGAGSMIESEGTIMPGFGELEEAKKLLSKFQ